MIDKLEFNGEQQYLDMLNTILQRGAFEGDERTGTGTYDIFGYQMRFDLSKGQIPLLTTKKMYTKGIITELAWFCRGLTGIRWLIDRGSNFWNADAHRAYTKDWINHKIKYLKNIAGEDEYVAWQNGTLKDHDDDLYEFYVKHNVSADMSVRPFTMGEFKEKILSDADFNEQFGDLGKVYGYQWTNWEKAAGGQPDNWIAPSYALQRSPDKDSIIQGVNCQYMILGGDESLCDIQFVDDNKVMIKYNTLKNVPTDLAHGGHISNPYKSKESINQLQNAIDALRNAPAGRRIIVSAWNPADIDTMTLPPCHLLFQFSSHKLTFEQRLRIYEEKGGSTKVEDNAHSIEKSMDEANIPKRDLGCQLYQRSTDSYLGAPFNIASYSILVHIIAEMLNYQPREFVWTSGSTHIYSNHVAQAKELIGRKPLGFPTIKFKKKITDLQDFTEEDIEIVGYEHHGKLSAPLNVG